MAENEKILSTSGRKFFKGLVVFYLLFALFLVFGKIFFKDYTGANWGTAISATIGVLLFGLITTPIILAIYEAVNDKPADCQKPQREP